MSEAVSQSHVLFVTYGGGHVNMVIPTAKELMQRGTKVSILGLTIAAPVLEKAGLPFYQVKDFLLPSDQEALEKGKSLAESFHVPETGISKDETIAYLGLCYQELEEQHGEEKAKALFAKHSRRCFYPYKLMTRIIKKLNPDAVIVTNSPRSEKAALFAANDLGIPSVAMIDLFGMREHYTFKATKICVLSPITRDALVRIGCNPNSIVITGNPSFDKTLDYQPPEKKPLSKNEILWIDQPSYWELRKDIWILRTKEDILNKLNMLAKLAHDLDFVLNIRPHPSQDIHMYRQFVKKQQSDSIQLIEHSNLYEVISQVDLVMGHTSTLIVEAILLGKEIIQVFDDPDEDFELPLEPYGLSSIGYDYETLKPLIQEKLSSPNSKFKIADELLKKEKAAPKVADVILAVAN